MGVMDNLPDYKTSKVRVNRSAKPTLDDNEIAQLMMSMTDKLKQVMKSSTIALDADQLTELLNTVGAKIQNQSNGIKQRKPKIFSLLVK